MVHIDKKRFDKNILIVIVLVLMVITMIGIDRVISIGGLDDRSKPIDPDNGYNANKLIISEVMTSNGGVFSDGDGLITDWVEIYNGTGRSINLLNHGLSDAPGTIRWTFPATILDPNDYVIVYLAGESRNGLYANFRLKRAGNETLYFYNQHGVIIDQVDIPPMDRNHSYAITADGSWTITEHATPGYPNTMTGRDAYLKSLHIEQSELLISEFLPKNEGNFIDGFGGFSGFVEVTNFSDHTIDLENYFLSNTLDVPYRWAFPKVVLAPGEAVSIFTSNRDWSVQDEIHASFTLGNGFGQIVLSDRQGNIIDLITYENVVDGFARAWVDGVWVDTPTVSPGFTNDPDGVVAFGSKYHPIEPQLQINEVMTLNTRYMAHNGLQTYPWIELINHSDSMIDLSEYSLTTSPNRPTMAMLPQRMLAPGEIIVFMASGEPMLSTSVYTHIEISLSSVDEVYLYHGISVIDSMFVANTPVNVSYGRMADGGFGYMSEPTPNRPNVGGTPMVNFDPVIKTMQGVYDDIDNLEIVIEGPSNIFYTTDGSIPTQRSMKYEAPFTIDKTTTIRARVIEEGKLEGSIVTASYIINEKHTMPVMSLTVDPGDYSFLLRDVWKVGVEVPANVAFFEEEGGFALDIGLRLFGGAARGLSKKSFALKFRNIYGASRLHYPVFESRDYSVFNTLVLRSGSQDYPNAFIRDVLGTSLVDGMMEVNVQAFKPVVLYINGGYWGIYNIREKVDEHFISTAYNVDTSADIVRIDNDVTAGSIRGYRQLVQYVAYNDMRLDVHYNWVSERLHMESFVDFWIASTLTTNNDIVNMRFFSHLDIDQGRWRMIFYDLDWAMYNYYRDYYEFATNPEGMTIIGYDTTLFRKLVQNEQFRNLFLERLSYHLKTTWNQQRVLYAIDEMVAIYLPEMERNQQRWNLSMDHWQVSVDRLRNYFVLRYDFLLRQTRTFFKLTNAEYAYYFGGL